MSRSFSVEVDTTVSVDITVTELLDFIEDQADQSDLDEISKALAKRGAASASVEGVLIENASEIIQDVLRELMLVGESAAIEMLRYEMRKQGVQVGMKSAAKECDQ